MYMKQYHLISNYVDSEQETSVQRFDWNLFNNCLDQSLLRDQ
jgi:hypothetical protein